LDIHRPLLRLVTLYLFFDESGDLSFHESASRYCLFGVLSTLDPTPINRSLTDERYRVLGEGTNLERFHAAEDFQAVRDRAFKALNEAGGFDFDVVAVEKRKAPPNLCAPESFYPHFGSLLLEAVFKRHTDPAQDVVLVTDTIPLKKHRKAIEKTFKQYVRRHLGGRRFAIYHHSSSAHPGLQAVDYCTWAVFRKYQRGDERSYDLIRQFIRSENEVFAGETTSYY
jgi:hypothetical protein